MIKTLTKLFLVTILGISFSGNIAAQCDVFGGILSTEGSNLTEVDLCTGDGNKDLIWPWLRDEEGDWFAWIITDENGTILELPRIVPFDFENAGAGTCNIYHLSYSGYITGLMVGNNIDQIEGCTSLSNPITVHRTNVSGGELTTTDGRTELEICAGDGQSDAFDVSLSNTIGTNNAWVITDDENNVLALPDAPPFDLEGAGAGTCLVWNISYEDGLLNLKVGLNFRYLNGCYALSNPITVYRLTGSDCLDDCMVNGGTVMGGPYEFCVGDSNPDNVANVSLENAEGANSQWVVTDEAGNILGLPPSPEAVDFNGAGTGTCLIWHLSYEDGLTGLEMGNNALTDLQGCYDLSDDFVTVVRTNVNGGTVAGGPYEFCVGDGTPDNVTNVTLDGAEGANAQWVVTDEAGNILGLPPSPEAVDFDGAGIGTCLIWHLSYEDGLMGLELGNNALEDLEGCYDLSDEFVTVVRVTGNDCSSDCNVNGGIVSGDDFEFCVGDDVADMVSGITLEGAEGSNSQWVVTDEDGNILGLPGMPGEVDFNGAGTGVCLIWHLSYEDGLMGLEMGNNALTDLEGCYDLSDEFITVVRTNVNGGTVFGGPFEFCVGDDTPDMVSGIVLEGAEGANAQWVVTDENGLILGLPSMPGEVDFDGAGLGTCLIWHLSYEDGLTGLEMGNNALNDLEGCYDLSDQFVTVVRVTGDDCLDICNTNGGIVRGGPYEFCVGDGDPDMVADVTLLGTVGANSQWVVTDEDGNILGLPPSPEAVDFDGAGEGTCLIWHLSYEDGLTGLSLGNNALTDLEGCYDLSDEFVTVVRMMGDDCIQDCEVEGGEISVSGFKEITICAGDGISDEFNVIINGYNGSNSGWIITDEAGNILALPITPPFDLEGAGPGVCLIWHIAYEDGLMGKEVGLNANDLAGCFDLSNPITVIRNGVNGGMVAGGPYEFCVGDGSPDNVSGVTLEGAEGSNSQWVVTDEDGNILGLPPTPEAVNFDGAALTVRVLV